MENFPRFLEDWGGRTLTYNGSMVVMFGSRFATKYWVAPPQFRKLVRGQWRVVAAN